jgi:hypothetical protein
MACSSVTKQRPQHTRGQQYGNSVFFVRGRAVAMQSASCDVIQQFVAVT